MGYTLTEKIIMKNTGRSSIKAGDLVIVNVDRVMVHDIFAPFVVEKFKEMGFEKVWDPNKIVFVYDHLVPTSFIEDFRHHQIGDAFAAEQGIKAVHRADGVCHQLMPELGYVIPGQVTFGTDSHTTTYGAVGAFATGIGYTEMAAIFGTGELWIKVPPTIKFNINGELPEGVFAKDIILTIIGDIGADGATYKAMEFGGSTVKALSVAGRMTLCNMAIEAGAKVGVIEPDEKTFAFSGIDGSDYQYLKSDIDACYEQVFEYDASQFKSVIACPSNVDNIKAVETVVGTKIDQGFIGSCTNGRLEDLEIAARILNRRKIAPYTKLIVTPASRSIYAEAVKKGFISIFVQAGAIVNPPGCGLCCGRSGGIVSDGETVIATNNRNFLGRMGGPKSEIFLASPATVAAAVLEGQIVDPRKYL
ncbi:3-isopropylmalate dehydratase large subunit [Sporomusa sp. KB1]|jgi:3-isopropylmalate/(R)-2-methylmalate dehydratase large subunit|uniref:3-isopropylmalate dehydratase large subunit n=1 Tax=Sporomusa sp. KB1 TaxID=943346 RepID=UPI00119F6F67|nr:3-isopropylmalate dehydratase large subunit [Sporomusa sp. KB1]TWH47121.1 3-isopropylmalate/(R)-2-methylmalate dehydratase large subunit [Sporomusa sp. KB1]